MTGARRTAPLPLRAFLPSLSLSLPLSLALRRRLAACEEHEKGATATAIPRLGSATRTTNSCHTSRYTREDVRSRYTLAIPPARPGTRRGRSTTVTTRRANRGTASGHALARSSAAPAREVHRRARRASLSRSVPPSRGDGARSLRARGEIKMKPRISSESECESVFVIVISHYTGLFLFTLEVCLRKSTLSTAGELKFYELKIFTFNFYVDIKVSCWDFGNILSTVLDQIS